MKPEGWKVLCVEPGLANASIVAGRLEAEGIPVRLHYDAVAAIYGLTLDGLGQVKILVPEEDLSLALAIIGETYTEEDFDWEGGDESQ